MLLRPKDFACNGWNQSAPDATAWETPRRNTKPGIDRVLLFCSYKINFYNQLCSSSYTAQNFPAHGLNQVRTLMLLPSAASPTLRDAVLCGLCC